MTFWGLDVTLASLVLGSGLVTVVLGYLGAPFWIWSFAGLGLLLGTGAPAWLTGAFVAIALVFDLRPLRRALVSSVIFRKVRALKLLPRISPTERVALEAGSVWVESEYFSGAPRHDRLFQQPYPRLTPEEKAFVDGPVEELCRMTDDWEIWREGDLPAHVWDHIKKERYLGMIIPREYGGLGFSALAHSQVIMKLATRSVPVCITVMVPNSLGPAELIVHYGTQEQKDHYLPRLARGEEIPCFALTEPKAGSDASGIQASGEIFRGEDGRLSMKLNWNKRWITLAAISTVLGLAFKLRDPENLLGQGEDLGITCALIPSKSPGVTLGRRHDAMGVPFYNCPTTGKDVIVPVDCIVGGIDGAGHGWKMLMECLAAGRGISLPAQATGQAKQCLAVASAHASVRRQFGLSIGKFEGIEEPLARIGGLTYLLEAARIYTLGALDGGTKPPVVSAIAKYNFTEVTRGILNDAMDILGGAGISRGPKNHIANAVIAAPIGITVEGANILTRTLMIFGQGALRAHPYAFREVRALEADDLAEFDRAFWSHINHVVRNLFRSVLLSVSRGFIVPVPGGGPLKRYHQRLQWASASFALMTDVAMAGLGGKLKVKEKLTGRFADIVSWLYLATAVLRRFEAEGRRPEDLPLACWSLDYAFHRIQLAFDGLFVNFDVPVVGWLMRWPVALWSRVNGLGQPPSDRLGGRVAALIQVPGAGRDALLEGMYRGTGEGDPRNQLEAAMDLTFKAEAVYKKVRRAVAMGTLPKLKGTLKLYKMALELNVIAPDEYVLVEKAEVARDEAIQVDSFDLEEYRSLSQRAPGAPPAKKRVSASSAS